MNSNNKNAIVFSVIIPVQKINNYIKETCAKLEETNSVNFETIILPDEKEGDEAENEQKFRAKIIPTGKVGPAEKRDRGADCARGKFLVFIDDDAYPEKNYFEEAIKHLEQEEVAAVGGPQFTPPSDNFWQRASGAMFLSPLSGFAVIRFWPGNKIQEIDDWPTVNFIIKKKDFDNLGGFDTEYWPGEDTKLCLDIIKKLGKKILYIPGLRVYHHRRASLVKHLKQTGGYGLHRGYFAKAFPQTSMKLSSLYFVPSLWVLFLFLGGVGSFFSDMILEVYRFGLLIYLGAIFLSTLVIWIRTKDILVSIASVPYLVLFHLWYGARFIQGYVFTKELKSKLRG